ncbi:MAG TPA: hypothetical protein PLO64_07340 [Methanothermobacter sp.]|nr:Tat pathway signal sequence domain protein [Methanothermobacter sp. MT-2]HHW05177.1 hypothetical protein [Methanothermobacter sp.]HOK73311.1 hypothetical protein [Methanothermobacter sp.]HOL69726.1 hypothetical protein [Methanothermobacter sp.]HPQ05178.1 hypothetical protein [Methanothermobacter sp.]
MDQKALIMVVGALLVGMVLGWILGIYSTQNLILNITNSSNQTMDDTGITQTVSDHQGNGSVTGTPDTQDTQEPSNPQDGTPQGNTSQGT